MKIVNLTQHNPTAEQGAAGVFNAADDVAVVKAALLFTTLPSVEEISSRAQTLAQIAKESGAEAALIGGAPYLMGALETALKAVGVKPLYSFTERVSVETTNEAGEVVKTNVFKHIGFVEV